MNAHGHDRAIDLLGLAELCCWTIVALTPILIWVNGPSVSTDQFVFRIGFVALAACGGIGLRVHNLRRGRRPMRDPPTTARGEKRAPPTSD